MSALVNAIRILRRVAECPDLSLAEIARATRLSKSNVHRLLRILTAEGMLARDADTGRYRLGLALFALGASAVATVQLSSITGPYLGQLAHRTGETVQLGVLDGLDVFYIHQIESRPALNISARIGGRLPAYCTATGKALLAYQPPGVVESVLASELPRLTPFTITDPDALRDQLEQVRRRGYATCDQEPDLGARAASACIFNGNDEPLGAITICAPLRRCPDDQVRELGRLVVEASRHISRQMAAGAAQRSVRWA